MVDNTLEMAPNTTVSFKDMGDTMLLEIKGKIHLKSNAVHTARIHTLPALASIVGTVVLDQTVLRSNFDISGLTPRGDAHFIASPMREATFGQWANTHPTFDPPSTQTIFKYTEADIDPVLDENTGRKVIGAGWQRASGSITSLINPSGKPTAYLNFIKSGIQPPFFSQTSFGRQSGTISSQGTPFQHTYTYPITFTPEGYEGGGWNLIANPYPAELDWAKIIADPANQGQGIRNTFAIWNPDTRSYKETDSSTGSDQKIISASQSFFIRSAGAGTLTLKESHKADINMGNFKNAFLRTDAAANTAALSPTIIWMGYKFFPLARTNTEVNYVPGKSTRFFDSDPDRRYLGSIDTNITFWTMASTGEDCSLNSWNDEVYRNLARANNGIKIRPKCNYGTYFFYFDSTRRYHPNKKIFLRDNQVRDTSGLDTLHDIRLYPRYDWVKTTQGFTELTGRFMLVTIGEDWRPVGTRDSLPAKRPSLQVQVSPNPRPRNRQLQLRIQHAIGSTSLQVLDVQGRSLHSSTLAPSTSSQALALPPLPPGLYFLRCQNANGTIVKRVVLE